jgi:hypothetical protein
MPKIRDYYKTAPIEAVLLYITLVLILITLLASFMSPWFIPTFIASAYFYFRVGWSFTTKTNELDNQTKRPTGYYKKNGEPVYVYTSLSMVAIVILLLLAMITAPFIAMAIGVTL